MDKISKETKETKVVFMGDNMPEELMAQLKEAFPNAESLAAPAEAEQVNQTVPPGDSERAEGHQFSPLMGFIRECLLQRDATTTGCDKHKPVLDEKERAKEESVEDTVRRVAYGKLQVVAGEYGLRFNAQELIALYHLSAAANPKVAINAAHDMCRQFIDSWGV